ncbi:MAG: transglutaminase-like domain-containing protein [Planctomycetota bacterium]
MRLYVDRFTRRGRTRLLLLTVDAFTAAMAITFASGAWQRLDQGIDLICLAAWAAVPRLVSPYVRWLRRPRPFLETLGFALVLVVTSGAMFAIGVDLLWEGVTGGSRPTLQGVAIVFALWASTFFLFHPPWYRVNDLALIGAVAVGLVDRQPYPVVAVVLLLVGLALSGATRHLLHNVYFDVRRPRINLQNARAAAFLTALCGSLGFFGLYLLFSYWVPYELPGTIAERGVSSGRGSVGSPLGREGGIEAEGERGEGEDAVGSQGGEATSVGAEIVGASPEVAVGYTPIVRLDDPRPSSDRESSVAWLRVHAKSRGWKPTNRTLFRISTVTDVGETGERWLPQLDPELRTWAEGERLPGDWHGMAPNVGIEILVVARGIPGPPTPYFSTSLGPSPSDRRYRLTENGDIVIIPTPPPGERYSIEFVDAAGARAELLSRMRIATGRHPDPRTLELPEPAACGVDFQQIAETLFAQEATIGGKIRELRSFFRRSGFEYTLTPPRGEKFRPLVSFLIEHRQGDCNFFSIAAALVLRGGGVSTRLAAGFSGAEFDPTSGLHLIQSKTAHAWVEVYVPGTGWAPIDPTTWVSGAGEGDPTPTVDPVSDVAAENPQPPRPSGDSGERGAGELDSFADESRSESRRVEESAPPSLESSADPFDGLDPRDAAMLAAATGYDRDGGSESGGEKAEVAAVDPSTVGDLESGVVAERTSEEGLSQSSALLRFVLVLVVGSLAWMTVRRMLDPRRDDDDLDVPVEETRRSRSVASVAVEPPAFTPETADDHILYHYQMLQYDLSHVRRHRRTAETPHQHHHRLAGQDERADRAARQLLSRVYGVLYGTSAMTDHDVSEVEECCRVIKRAWS